MMTKSLSFLSRLSAVVRELEQHPRVRVTCYHMGPPAPSAALRRLERHLGGEVPAALEQLYREADGVQLRWHVIAPGDRDPQTPREPPAGLARVDQLDEDGIINLLSIDAMLEDERCVLQGVARIRVCGRLCSRGQLAAGTLLLDGFSGYAFTLLTAPPTPSRGPPPGWRALTMYDYGLACPGDGSSTIDAYLERLLATRGLMIARTDSYCAERGIGMPPLPKRWRGDPGVLEGLLTAAEEGW